MTKLRNLLLIFLIFAGISTAQTRRFLFYLIPDVSDANTGELRFLEQRATGTNYVGFEAPNSITSNIIWTLPATDSSGTQCLASNGSMVLSWNACSAGSSPPFDDATYIVKGSVTPTDQIRFEVDTVTGSRTLTVQDASYTLAGTNLAQSISGVQTFTDNIITDHIRTNTDSTYDIGEKSEVSGNRFRVIYSDTLNAAKLEAGVPSNTSGEVVFAHSSTASTANLATIIVDSAPSIQVSNLTIWGSGNFYNRVFTGDISCSSPSTVSPGWNGFQTTTNEMQFCGTGGTTRLIPSVSISDTPQSATCSTGTINSMTVTNGIITAISCS